MPPWSSKKRALLTQKTYLMKHLKNFTSKSLIKKSLFQKPSFNCPNSPRHIAPDWVVSQLCQKPVLQRAGVGTGTASQNCDTGNTPVNGKIPPSNRKLLPLRAILSLCIFPYWRARRRERERARKATQKQTHFHTLPHTPTNFR